MDSKTYLFDRAVITWIQKVNKHNTRSNIQSEQKYGILQEVINGTGKKTTKITSSTGKVKDGRETNTTTKQKTVT